MDAYDANRHLLLRDVAHKARLTPQEYPDFEARLRDASVEIVSVEIPEWPPVEKSRLFLLMGGDDPWEGQYWTGTQEAIVQADRPARRMATATAREMAGPAQSSKRMAYAWQVPEFDPARHILMRQWLADTEVSIVDFLRKFIPEIREELGRDPLFEVANPHVAAEIETRGSYSPTRRALAVADLPVLERFALSAERFTYEAEQPVTWVRSLDDSRWEARRQHEPQRARWETHRSWIVRPIGAGAWTEADRGPEGHAFGPFMELWDDGAIYLWCSRRALGFLDGNPLIVNGARVQFTPETTGIVCRMAGRVDDVGACLAGAMRVAYGAATAGAGSDSEAGGSSSSEPLLVDCLFERRGAKPFWRPANVQALPERFHRSSGSPLVFRHRDAGGEVRAWGDPALLGGFVLNGVQLTGFAPWNSGFRIQVDRADADRILGKASRAPDSAPAPEEAPSPASDVTAGAEVYSPGSVIAALELRLGRSVSLFGRSASDSAVVALTRDGLTRFLLDDLSDRDAYVLDTGGRNYDCENFAEALRVNLARKHGVNGCMVIWGDGHAWNAVCGGRRRGAGDRPGRAAVRRRRDQPDRRLFGGAPGGGAALAGHR